MEKKVLHDKLKAILVAMARCQDERWYYDGCKIGTKMLMELINEVAAEPGEMDNSFDLLSSETPHDKMGS